MTVRFNLLALILIAGLAACEDDDSGSSSSDDNDATQDVTRGNNDNLDATTTLDTTTSTCGAATQCAGNSDCTDQEFCSAGCCTPRSTPTTDTTTGGEDCGDVDFLGECQGTEAVWCGDSGLARVDCATYVPEGSTGACAYLDDEIGYWCTTEVGDPCYFVGDDNQPFTITCVGDESACVLTFESSACTADVGTCTEDDTNGCFDDTNMMLGCSGGSPVLYDCGSASATCDEAGEDSKCIGVPAEGQCLEGLQECADGLDCVGESDTEPGTCTASE